ncbi:hypothetical protein AAFF_G00181130 [Aldrovandia affinis]|uniref:Uncharacterized protein n=1 Tax=Aldrovandia affinis TaxID=143900 RepID=A0AAD7SZ86_9TELE|nr:hypothetical protein AAFF_G00181130 [Aldrovandia affinis]
MAVSTVQNRTGVSVTGIKGTAAPSLDSRGCGCEPADFLTLLAAGGVRAPGNLLSPGARSSDHKVPMTFSLSLSVVL